VETSGVPSSLRYFSAIRDCRRRIRFSVGGFQFFFPFSLFRKIPIQLLSARQTDTDGDNAFALVFLMRDANETFRTDALSEVRRFCKQRFP